MRKQKLPKWMKPYLPLIVNTGGNDVEEMYNGHADPYINLPLSTLQACVKSQIALLSVLQDKEQLLGDGLKLAADVCSQRAWSAYPDRVEITAWRRAEKAILQFTHQLRKEPS